jgi:hypothetical protein
VKPISPRGILIRYLIAFALVIATWNPSQYNFVGQAQAFWSVSRPAVLIAGLILVIVWVVFLRATTRSLGVVGLILATALAGAILWLVIDFDLIDPANATTLSWVVLVLLAAVLTAGMSWSHLRRRWSGQADIDDVDDDND